MGDPLTGERFLMGKLTSDATLVGLVGINNIYSEVAAKAAPYPFVVIEYLDGRNVLTINGTIVMVDEMYVVKAVTCGRSYTPLEAIVKRIHQILHKSSGTVSGGMALACIEEYPVKYPEFDEEDGEFRHLGAGYRVLSQ